MLRITFLTVCYLGMWSCNRHPHPEHLILNLKQAKVIKEWSVSVDSLPGISGIYHMLQSDGQDLSLVVMCYDTITRKHHHIYLNFGDGIERTELTGQPIQNFAYFFSMNRYICFDFSENLLLKGDAVNGISDTLTLNSKVFFSPDFPPLGDAFRLYVQANDLSHEWRNVEQQKIFFEQTKPIILIDTALSITGSIGAYPPDYSKKKIYGYHLAPQLAADNKTIFLSYPGSSLIGRANIDDGNTTFFPMSSAFEVDYQSMDTSDFMQVSKAIQFQDTASRYIQMGISAQYNKVARIYSRHRPFTFEDELFNGSVVVGDISEGIVEVEYLLNKEKDRMQRMLLVEQGLLLLNFTSGLNGDPLITFTLLDIYADPIAP